MNRFPVDVRAYGAVMAADAAAQPVRAYENGTATGGQSVSPEGVPMWRSSFLFRTAEGVETVAVKFPAAVQPSFVLLSEVTITGLTAFATSDGKVYLSASAVAPAAMKGSQS
jgi:hypothetical protein